MTSEHKKETILDRARRGAAASTSTGEHGTPEPEPVTQVLQGDLKDKPIGWLLRAAQHYEVTGCLLVGSPACNVTIEFGLGRAVHAHSPFSKGAEAIMDLFVWKDGKVKFVPGKHPDTCTVQESIDELICRGDAYYRNLIFLEEQYIGENSFLLRPPGKMSPKEIDRRLARGQRIDRAMQAEFYSNIYGTRNIKDTAEKLNLTTSQWVSITANLLQLGILLTPDGRNVQSPDYDFSYDPTASQELAVVFPPHEPLGQQPDSNGQAQDTQPQQPAPGPGAPSPNFGGPELYRQSAQPQILFQAFSAPPSEQQGPPQFPVPQQPQEISQATAPSQPFPQSQSQQFPQLQSQQTTNLQSQQFPQTPTQFPIPQQLPPVAQQFLQSQSQQIPHLQSQQLPQQSQFVQSQS
ncbi:MAG TPA: DUF4388 domain-containing protein, partial [Candidatus Obscuribacterales bacterium]